MPGLISSVRCFNRTNIPKDVWDALRANAARANVILPHAEKVCSHPEFLPGSEQLWMVYSEPGTSVIRFILSCTEGPLGTYPIFIVPTAPIVELIPELLQSPMEALCNALLNEPNVRRQRVFSVFSVEPVTIAFARAWEKIAEINCIKKPYYDAIFTMCTPETLVFAPATPLEDEVIELRLAVSQDVDKISTLCQEFANTSPPFTLTSEQASKEASLLIENGQVWVYEIEEGEETDIASIVAVTRESKDVAAITKVYTPEKWGRKGRAERLVRRVCKELLKTHEQVVLYVGAENRAKRLYDRLGFQGLSAGSPPIDGVENWLEIGFDKAEVELGHW